MPSTSSLLSMAAAVTGASAAFQGFNYGSGGKNQQDFEALFKNAQSLEGTDGAFTSARLYTMIQDGTTNTPISAIPAAISTKTSLLFGLWASGGEAQFNNELAALKSTISQYCGQLDGLVAGISVGSEDLYRDSPIGMTKGSDPGAGPDVLSNYVDQTRAAIKGSCLEKVPIGHVDTWTAYANQTNRAFSDKLDFVGMDAYPYYEDTKDNTIGNAKEIFDAAIANTNAGTGNKPLWITETGWPVSGPVSNQAQPSTDNAQTFWREIGCPRFGNVNIWWYTQEDGGPSSSSTPSFGVVGAQLSSKPLYDLSCKGFTGGSSSSSSSSASSSASASSTSTSSGNVSSASGTTEQSASSTPSQSASSSAVVVTTGASGTGSSAPSTMSTAAPTSSGPVGTGSQPSSSASTSGSAPSSSTVPVHNAAAGFNSAGAAVAALAIAVAAF